MVIEDATQKVDFRGVLNNTKLQKAQQSTTLSKAYTQDRLYTKETSLIKTNNTRNHQMKHHTRNSSGINESIQNFLTTKLPRFFGAGTKDETQDSIASATK